LQGIFYDHLEYFMAVWYNLWPVGIVCGNLVCFSQFGMFGSRKNLATLFGRRIPSHQAHMYESLWPLVHLKFASIISVYTGAILRSRHISRQKMICMYAGKNAFSKSHRRTKIASFRTQIARLRTQTARLRTKISRLRTQIVRLTTQIARLRTS
jgi:hypothetical protein